MPAEARLDYLDAMADALGDEALWDRVRAYARRRCCLLERAGLPADPEELTMDAISDTATGVRIWKPEQCDLHVHLCGVIRSRTSIEIERSLRVRYVPLGSQVDRDGHDRVEAEVCAAVGSEHPAVDLALGDRVDRTIATLSEMAAANNDNQVLQLLEVFSEGMTERRDVAERLGLSNKKYRNARLRLMRMAAKLPEGLLAGGPFND